MVNAWDLSNKMTFFYGILWDLTNTSGDLSDYIYVLGYNVISPIVCGTMQGAIINLRSMDMGQELEI
jgi:hypothetical protein